MKRRLFFKPEERKSKRVHLVRFPSSKMESGFASTGFAAVKAKTAGYMKASCIEACRRIVRRAVKKAAKLRIALRPYLPMTKKPAEVRMGKGKGKVDDYYYPVYPGKILFELSGIPAFRGRPALRKTLRRLPVSASVVVLRDR